MKAVSTSEIFQTLTVLFREILDEPTLVLREDLTAADVKSWDSLNHIDLIVAVEREFGIRFTTREVTSLKNVGELVALTQAKLSAAS
jgi:acyl carrier protein